MVVWVAVVGLTMPLRSVADEHPGGKLGGPCLYRDYPGKATITKIVKTKASKAQLKSAGYEGYEVWYKYEPKWEIPEEDRHDQLKSEQQFQLANTWYPGDQYIKKYGLKVGKELPCTYSVIKSGTCTPVQFNLEGPDPVDYFEVKPLK